MAFLEGECMSEMITCTAFNLFVQVRRCDGTFLCGNELDRATATCLFFIWLDF